MKPPNAGTDSGHTPPASQPDALVEFDALRRQWREHHLALFLDYDGTLTPIAARPELATLHPAIRELLARLINRYPVAIVSGRGRRDVKRLVGLEGLIYAGSHGFDISGPAGFALEHEEGGRFLDALDRAQAQLDRALSSVQGVLVERKRFAIAVHYRLVAPDEVPLVALAVDRAANGFPRALRQTGGKKVFELRPCLPWDKGSAVRWLLDNFPGQAQESLFPVYIGDDETDEDAFAVVRELGGIAIVVSATPRVSLAHYRLADTDAVAALLQRLTELN